MSNNNKKEIYVKEVKSPVGSLYPAVREDMLLSCSFWADSEHPENGSSPVLDDTERFIRGYFDKTPMKVSIVLEGKTRKVSRDLYFFTDESSGGNPLDLSLRINLSGYTEKEFDIYEALFSVPCGEVISYGELAARAGLIAAGRFAGNTMAKNSFPLIIPCHRVVKADGSPGNYTSGPWKKVFLLKHEEQCS